MGITANTGRKVVTVGLAERIDPCVPVLRTDPTVNVTVPTIKSRLRSLACHKSDPLCDVKSVYAAFKKPMLCLMVALPPPRSSVTFQ